MKEEFYSKLEAYWSDRMPGKEKADFEHRLRTDESFAREVQLYIQSRISAKIIAREKLREKLSKLGDEILEEESMKQSPMS